MSQVQLDAFIMGAVSSSSFPLGAMLGMCVNLPPKVLAALLAYGGGALLFALAKELFIDHFHNPNLVSTICLSSSALLGALAFMKLASMLDNLEKKKSEKRRQRQRSLVTINRDPEPTTMEARLNEPLSRSVAVDEEGKPIVHRKRIHTEPDANLSEPILGMQVYDNHVEPPLETEWTTEPEPQEPGSKASVAISMWLGVMLDSIPESMYFGLSALNGNFSIALLVGVFFANLPEAVSSASMQKKKDHPCKIISMWGGITLSTSLIAVLATFLFPSVPKGMPASEAQEIVLLICSGLAGGAMLGMVSSTMLPEAFEVGGRNIVSMSTVLGFLVAMLFSLWE